MHASRTPAATVTVLALLLATTACTAAPPTSGTGAAPAAGPPPAPSRQARDLRLPLDVYALTDADTNTLDDAQDVLLRRCMKDQGMDWKTLPRISPRDLEPQNRRRYGAIEAAVARRYGYHPPPAPPALTRRDRAWDEREELPAGVQRAAYGPSGDGGCLKEAMRRLGGGLPQPDAHTFNQLTGTALDASQRDPAVRAAMRKWSACMRRAGFDYPDALAAAGDRRWTRTAHATPDERAVAGRDVACKDETQLVQVWVAAETRIQQHQIRAHTPALRQAKARKDRWLAAAHRVLETSG
ncbi:hypothetical protein ACH4FX_40365 [Streptomyces sp. NPDC018019]|uniref:hypothetical protein n=1 Tax=Streptomyces sp. NPDC018019 TaxID=3365030 RepID=UPI0037A6A0CD